ncbi:MAG: diguanylate cyclase [Planctomycetota bacterium]
MPSVSQPKGEDPTGNVVRALLRVLPLPIVWFDPDGRVRAANPAAGEWFAREVDDLVGLEAEALASPTAVAAWRDLLRRAQGGEQVSVDRGLFPSARPREDRPPGRNGSRDGNHSKSLLVRPSDTTVGFVLSPLGAAPAEHLGVLFHEDVSELRGIGEMLMDVNRELRQLVRADPLTGLANRREYERLLRTEVGRAARIGAPVSILMIDVDEFKAFNDELGHRAGDRCLAAVAAALRSGLLRPADAVARYGGEEFVALLPGTDSAGARLLAERLRRAVERLAIHHPRSSAGRLVTVSIGVATVHPTPGYDGRILQEAADRGLYLAKDAGRNQVRVVEVPGADGAAPRVFPRPGAAGAERP